MQPPETPAQRTISMKRTWLMTAALLMAFAYAGAQTAGSTGSGMGGLSRRLDWRRFYGRRRGRDGWADRIYRNVRYFGHNRDPRGRRNSRAIGEQHWNNRRLDIPERHGHEQHWNEQHGNGRKRRHEVNIAAGEL